MKDFFIYPNLGKAAVRDILPVICDFLRRDNLRIMLPERAMTVFPFVEAEFVPEAEAVKSAFLAVVLGGDGTMLRLARLAALQDLPVLGINIGHIGFMTELEPNELGQMEKLFTDEYTIDSRMMIRVEVKREEQTVYETDALNDIVVTKGAAFRMAKACILADEEEVTCVSCDGVIVCTPTGSTAYGLSAGGPVIEPSAENLAVIPICAHALTAKSFVFAPERRITLTAYCEGCGEVYLSADGGEGFKILPEDRVEITRSPLRTRLVRLKGNSFYKILQQKL